MLSKSDFELVAFLTSKQFGKNPITVEGIVRQFGLSQSLASQRLRKLEREGYLERLTVPTPTGRVVHYRPRPRLQVQWISPAEQVALRWTVADEVDWTFPLVSQVPDQAARFTVLALLQRLLDAHLLLPHTFAPDQRKSTVRHLGLSVIVYGSCARGTARPGSDVDVLSVQAEDPASANMGELVEDIAADVSLSAARPIQLKHLQGDEFVALPSSIKGSIQSEGLVVHDGLRSKERGDSRGVWGFVYGGRLSAHVR